MKRALITGVTGQDGSYLAELLLDKGYEVHGIKRRSSLFNTERVDHLYEDPHTDHARFKLHFGDLTDTSNLYRLMAEVKPDEVYNLGAQSHVAVSFDTPEYTANVDALGTLRLLEAIRVLGLVDNTRFYQASTSEMFGSAPGPQSETTPFHPRSPYAVAKVYAHAITVNYREAYGLFAASGILFNHESPRRGETFVTRKITRGLSRIALGLERCLYLGNLDALRDWGHARDYMGMAWTMLQQDRPDDYVIATGEQHSVRRFLEWAAQWLGLEVGFEGQGTGEMCVVRAKHGERAPEIRVGDVIMRVDPRYYRPAEAPSLHGDASKARLELGWRPSVGAKELCAEMMDADWHRAGGKTAALEGASSGQARR